MLPPVDVPVIDAPDVAAIPDPFAAAPGVTPAASLNPNLSTIAGDPAPPALAPRSTRASATRTNTEVTNDEALKKAGSQLHRQLIGKERESQGPQNKNRPLLPPPDDFPAGTRVVIKGSQDGEVVTAVIVERQSSIDACTFFYKVRVDGTNEVQSVNEEYIGRIGNPKAAQPTSPARSPPAKRNPPEGGSPPSTPKRTSFAPDTSSAQQSPWNLTPLNLPASDTTKFTYPEDAGFKDVRHCRGQLLASPTARALDQDGRAATGGYGGSAGSGRSGNRIANLGRKMWGTVDS